MEVKFVELKDCSPSLYKKFRDLNYRDRGLMRKTLSNLKRNRQNAYINYIEKNGKVLSWSLSFNYYENKLSSYFYTRKLYRKKGLAYSIFKQLNRFCKINKYSIMVYPHDKPSELLFSKCRRNRKNVMVSWMPPRI